MSTNGNDSNLSYNIFQLAIFCIILGLIILRGVNYRIQENNWIWIVNYIGMGIACINLLINKCFSLKENSSEKYKPFVGFTIIILVIICVLAIPVYKSQSGSYSQSTNDLITLLALFFSLSHSTWNAFLNFIVRFLKK